MTGDIEAAGDLAMGTMLAHAPEPHGDPHADAHHDGAGGT